MNSSQQPLVNNLNALHQAIYLFPASANSSSTSAGLIVPNNNLISTQPTGSNVDQDIPNKKRKTNFDNKQLTVNNSNTHNSHSNSILSQPLIELDSNKRTRATNNNIIHHVMKPIRIVGESISQFRVHWSDGNSTETRGESKNYIMNRYPELYSSWRLTNRIVN